MTKNFENMPTTCIVPGCDGTDPGRHKFPSDPELNLKWRTAIKKEVTSTITSSSSEPQKILWRPSKYSRVCGAHFKAKDFKETLASMYSANPTVRICVNILLPSYELMMLDEANGTDHLCGFSGTRSGLQIICSVKSFIRSTFTPEIVYRVTVYRVKSLIG